MPSPSLKSRPHLGSASSSKPARSRAWLWLLVLPYLGLCVPVLYARNTPTLWGFPFFYWYQFAWVLLTAALMALVYRKTRR